MALIPRKRMASDLLDPEPREGSYNGVTSDGVFKGTSKAIDNILDDGSASEAIVVAVPSSQSSDYVVGNYYEVQGKVAKLRTKTEGDNVTQLTFDTTSGVLDAINGVVEDIASIGSPLQWKGPATVSELNTGITGIQPGWTYTLTDAGTLTDGSVVVDVGDEVAWTEDGEWFKVGGEGGVKVFTMNYSDGAWNFPAIDGINAAVMQQKVVYLLKEDPGAGKTYYPLAYRGSGSGNITLKFYNAETGSGYRGYQTSGGVESWTEINANYVEDFAPAYDSTATYAVGDFCTMLGELYTCTTAISTAEEWNSAHWTQTNVAAQIGNVEALLAAL